MLLRILSTTKLSARSKVVLIGLLTFSDGGSPYVTVSLERISLATGCTRHTVMRSLHSLVSAGAIELRRRRGKVSTYRLMWDQSHNLHLSAFSPRYTAERVSTPLRNRRTAQQDSVPLNYIYSS